MKRLVAVGVCLSLLFLGTPAQAAGSTMSADFPAVVGVHPGSDVRILGVRVGEVTSVVPMGDKVRVHLRYNGYLPKDVTAIIVPPSIVSDRYIQLAPPFTGGPVLPDRSHITRTGVPLELDDVYRALDQLNRDLGPHGANQDGALSRLVEVGRANLEGNGQALDATLEGTSKALSTLADGRQDLFASVVNLQRFTSMLARNDEQVRAFNKALSSVAQQLAADAGELELALRKLSHALVELASFVRDNRAQLASNVEALVDITNVLVRQQQAVIDVLDVAPLALSNLGLSYNPLTGTTDTRNNATGPHNAAAYICSLMVNVLPAPEVPQQCFDLAKLVQP
ncbi:MAG TPA: MCE family protein [Candidatus Limnocylindrales bacterium]|nr:MCE family protein [Candidatus Limnocylindrales bacterium]